MRPIAEYIYLYTRLVAAAQTMQNILVITSYYFAFSQNGDSGNQKTLKENCTQKMIYF